MTMTADQILDVRDWVGLTPTDAELQVLYTRVGSVYAVALSVLRARRSALRETLAARPSKFSASGDYSEDRTNDRTIYDSDIARLQDLVTAESGLDLDNPVLKSVGAVGRADRDGLFGV